jgi:hypothetical protein
MIPQWITSINARLNQKRYAASIKKYRKKGEKKSIKVEISFLKLKNLISHIFLLVALKMVY